MQLQLNWATAVLQRVLFKSGYSDFEKRINVGLYSARVVSPDNISRMQEQIFWKGKGLSILLILSSHQ